MKKDEVTVNKSPGLWKLYLDDERPLALARDSFEFSSVKEFREAPWFHAKTFGQAVAHILYNGMPLCIDFDHDLGKSLSGMDLAEWIVEHDQENDVITKDFSWSIHSGNWIGAENIDGLLKNYMKNKFGTKNS